MRTPNCQGEGRVDPVFAPTTRARVPTENPSHRQIERPEQALLTAERAGPRRSAAQGVDAVAGAYARPAAESVPPPARAAGVAVSGRSVVPVMEAAEDGRRRCATVFRALTARRPASPSRARDASVEL